MTSLAKSLVAAGFALALIAMATTASAGNRNHRRHYRPPQNERPVPAIPEPSSVLVFAAGLFAVNAATRRRAAR